MQKLMKNWIFTMIACILLTILATFMFLDGFDVGGLHVVDRMLHLVVAMALAIYTVFVLFPLVVRYGGILRGFVLGEIAVLLFTSLAHICMEWFTVPLISAMEICAVIGLVLWLRTVVEIVHAYLSGEGTDGRVPLWKLLLYILLAAVGVWQMASPLISDKHFIFAIGTAAAVMALLFAGITVSNRKSSAPERAAKKKEKAEKAGGVSGELPAAESDAALPAPTQEE